MATEQNKYSYRLALRDDILSNEDEKVVENKLAKMNKEDINTILCSVGVKAQKPTTIDLMIKYGADVNIIEDIEPFLNEIDFIDEIKTANFMTPCSALQPPTRIFGKTGNC